MEIVGVRAAIRAGTKVQALAFQPPSSPAYRAEPRKNLAGAPKKGYTPFGDCRGRQGAPGS